jgi:hypothetical protein
MGREIPFRLCDVFSENLGIGGFRHSMMQDIRSGETFPVLLVSAFTLIGGKRTAPQKIFWKAHFFSLGNL